MELRDVVIYAAFYSLSLIFGILLCLKTFVSFLINPRHKFWQSKTRNELPAILRDNALGQHDFIQLEDIKLHYVHDGSQNNELMLFLHGFPEFWLSWRHQMKEFSKDYWVVAVDMRGYGESGKKSGVNAYHLDILVDDVRKIILALGKKKCILVAHDWGGLIAHSFIRKYPEMLHKYILMNTMYLEVLFPFMAKKWSQLLKSWYIFFFHLPYLPEFYLCMNDLQVFDLIKKGAMPEEIEAYKYTFRDYTQLNGPINYYRANCFPDTSTSPKSLSDERLNESAVQGLYIHGTKDLAITEEAACSESWKGVHNLTTVKIPGADHFVQTSAPDQVNRIMRDFLNKSLS